jgi:predicted metal-binding membrane protein
VIAIEAILRRDRAIVGAALAAIALLAWAYLFWISAHMSMPPAVTEDSGMAGMSMPGTAAAPPSAGMPDMGVGASLAPAFEPWAPLGFAFTFGMWAVMMAGMMTPSVAPMVLLYSAAGRKARQAGHPLAATGWFFAGYLLVWVAFSLAATVAQWTLTRLAVLTPMMASASTAFGGIVLVAAGIYQWTPAKTICLRQCQSPFGFLMSHGGFRGEPLGALRLGARHGLYCLGCCWALMALLFVGGVMNILWIAGLAILILLEKVVPTGMLLSRLSGALMLFAGIWLLVRAVAM